MNKGAILPLFYLPPTEFFANILAHKDHLLIEKYEHFPKQTYRNRASIASPQGKLDLIVPVIKGSKTHTLIKDVRISYDFNWQRLHWMSIQTSYRSSAFFEFYEDYFAPFYEKKWDFLFDYNEELLKQIFKLLKINIDYVYTTEYIKEVGEYEDYRAQMHAKRPSLYQQKPYFQIFEERNGFLPNLSVLDLLFSQGPQSTKFLV